MGLKRNEKSRFKGQNTAKSERKGRVDEGTLGYYRRVLETLKQGFDNEVEKGLFVSNVFKQLNNEAIKVSQNQTISRIVEELLKVASPSQLKSFMVALSEDWELVCTDRFASHVTQTAIKMIGQLPSMEDASGERSDDEDDVSSDLVKGGSRGNMTLRDLLKEVCSTCANNLALYMQDTYASHILRTVLEVLAGVRVSESLVQGKGSRYKAKANTEETKKKPIAELIFILNDMIDRILAVPMLNVHIQHPLSNPVLQTVLLISKEINPEKCFQACQVIMKSGILNESHEKGLLEMMKHEVSSHLIEQILAVSPPQEFAKILKSDICGHILELALHPVGNFVLKGLIKHTRSNEQVLQVYDELKDHFEDILAYDHIGIILSLADACLKHSTSQKDFVIGLLRAFHCHSPVERQDKCVPLFASLTTYEIFYKVSDKDKEDESTSSSDGDDDDDEESSVKLPTITKVKLQGSLLLQSLLGFTNPKLIVSSLLGLRTAELCVVSCDPSGSHVIEAFLKSSTVGEKSKEKLYHRLKGYYLEIACTKHGSRTFDALWECAVLKQRTVIAEELSQHAEKLRGNKFGFFVHNCCGLDHFLTRRKEWNEMQSGTLKKRKIFQEILGDAEDKECPKKTTKLKAIISAVEEKAVKLKLESSDEEVGEKVKVSQEHDVRPKKKKHKKHLHESSEKVMVDEDIDVCQMANRSEEKHKKKHKKRIKEAEEEEIPKKKRKHGNVGKLMGSDEEVDGVYVAASADEGKKDGSSIPSDGHPKKKKHKKRKHELLEEDMDEQVKEKGVDDSEVGSESMENHGEKKHKKKKGIPVQGGTVEFSEGECVEDSTEKIKMSKKKKKKKHKK